MNPSFVTIGEPTARFNTLSEALITGRVINFIARVKYGEVTAMF